MKQTVRVNGKRVIINTSAKGKVTVKPALPQEWELQAAQVRRLRKIPDILFVGGMEAGKRGPRAQVQALATGLTAGHPDLTIFLPGGRCAFIENKVGSGPLSPAQKDRHAALARLGHHVVVIRATTCEDAADKAEAAVRGWLVATPAGDEAYGRHMGYFAATNDALNLLNTFEERTIEKKDIYHAITELRPSAENDNNLQKAA